MMGAFRSWFSVAAKQWLAKLAQKRPARLSSALVAYVAFAPDLGTVNILSVPELQLSSLT